MSDFYKYFKENMEALGLTAPPESLFGTQQLAISTIGTIVAFIDKFGTKVTVMEMASAGTRLEQLTLLVALGASYYAGAAIGSLAVATGRTISGGTSLSSQEKFTVNSVPKPFIKDRISSSRAAPFMATKRRQKYLACFQTISMRLSSGL
jgi:hypothetical protein